MENTQYFLEWTYTPPDLFEEPADFPCEHGSIHIANGKVRLCLADAASLIDDATRNCIHERLIARFLAAQVISHQPYTLGAPLETRIYADGRREVTTALSATGFITFTGKADVVLTDASGKILRDTRADRIERRRQLAKYAAVHITDLGVQAVLRSYSAAVSDPRNELIHLYEVRDAISKRLGSRAAAAVGVSKEMWNRLGALANNEPLREGRHRGTHVGSLRSATETELTEAREIARSMIEGYLRHVSGSVAP